MATQLRSGADLNNQKITSLADGTAATDAVTKQQLDAIVRGLDWKNSVKAASTANLTLSGTQTVDGIALVAGDRVLAKDQTLPANNGIYVVAAGAWSRATDFDDSMEITAGAVVPVEQGTVNTAGGKGLFYLTGVTGAVTVGTTALTFSAVGSGGGTTYTAADASIVVSGTTIAAKLKASNGILLDAVNGLYVDPAYNPNRIEADVPSGSASVAITHGLGTQYLSSVEVYDKSTNQVIECDKFATSSTVFTLVFVAAPTTGQYRYVMVK